MNNDTVAVDVDGTLIIEGNLNRKVVARAIAQSAKGKTVVLWSARGAGYARRIALIHDVDGFFDAFIGKPSVILDDHAWDWTKFTRTIHPKQLK